MPKSRQGRIAMFLPSMRRGGAERMMLNLLRGMTSAGVSVDLLLAQAVGPFLDEVPREVRVIDLAARQVRGAIVPLASYLRWERPQAILGRLCHANLALIAARMLARAKTRVVVTEASHVSSNTAGGGLRRGMPTAMRWLYPRADAVVAVSQGVADDLAGFLQISRRQIRVIYNPVVDASLSAQASMPCDHPWLAKPTTPVIVAVGRLGPEKDYGNLLRAFAMLRQARAARLVIFGEGAERSKLEALRAELGLSDCVDLPGATDNPYCALRRSSLFVLSSRFEGLPNTLIEALACGCPAVATDCPSGPREILAGGRFGTLVPCSQPKSLASAMSTALDRDWNRAELVARGAEFSVSKAVGEYLEVLGVPHLFAGATAA